MRVVCCIVSFSRVGVMSVLFCVLVCVDCDGMLCVLGVGSLRDGGLL